MSYRPKPYVIRYQKNGFWYTERFPTYAAAERKRQILLIDPDVNEVSKVGKF